MPAKVDEIWGERVNSIKGAHPKWGAGRTYQELKLRAEAHRRNDYPSERWVGQYLRDIWAVMDEEKQHQYSLLYWPESLERDELPWEASAACLELLGRVFAGGTLGEKRPTIRLARAFWRVTLAAPDLDAHKRVRFARFWSAWQSLGGHGVPQDLRNLERYLSFAPWRSEEAAAAAEKAHNGGEFDIDVPLTIPAGEYGDDVLLETYEEEMRWPQNPKSNQSSESRTKTRTGILNT